MLMCSLHHSPWDQVQNGCIFVKNIVFERTYSAQNNAIPAIIAGVLKLLTCCCHHFTDMLVEFNQNHIFLTLKMPKRATPVNVYQFLHKVLRTRALWRKNCQKSFRLLKSSKNPQLHCQHVLPPNLPMCLLKCSYVR